MAGSDDDERGTARGLDPLQRPAPALFATASVGLIEADLSRVRGYLDELDTGGCEIAAHLQGHPELAARAAELSEIRAVNAAALELIGADTGGAPATLGELVRASSEPPWLSLLEAIAQGAPRFESELRFARGDGDVHVLLSMNLPREPSELAHAVVSLLDITERKRLERQLWSAQRMEAIGRLTGGIAHDFNNLLMVISSYAGFVMDQLAEDSPAREDVKVIQDSAARAAELTSQLLAFGRRQVQQLEIVSLNSVVSALDRLLRRVIGEDIELSTELDAQLGWVNADRMQLEQILMNLVVNARDAMPDGGVLTIATANADVNAGAARAMDDQVKAGSYAVLSVRDTGIGMDEATRLRIFEPFFTIKDRSRASGLGLSTVYGMVKQSGGHICVRSEPGRGASFEIYLPRVDGAQAGAPAPRQRSPNAGLETVLLVEDEALVRAAARRILERNGYAVVEAQDGPQALELCVGHAGTIELLITDVVMPKMNGPELARQVRELRPSTKVIFVSGYADADLPDGAAFADATFLQKPFSPDTLLRKVRELLD